MVFALAEAGDTIDMRESPQKMQKRRDDTVLKDAKQPRLWNRGHNTNQQRKFHSQCYERSIDNQKFAMRSLKDRIHLFTSFRLDGN